MKSLESPVVAVEEVEDYSYKVKEETHKYETLSIQKFNDYLDLLKLKDKHPEFKEDIILQLQQFSNNTLIAVNNTTNFTIENLHQVGDIKTISDSVQKIKLVYQIISGTNKVTDSVFANITSRTVIIDGKETKSNKVKFSKK